MEFINERLGCRFTIPEKITVRDRLRFLSATALAIDDNYVIRAWQGIRPLIVEWECEHAPDHAAIDVESENLVIADIIFWVTNATIGAINPSGSVPPKNS